MFNLPGGYAYPNQAYPGVQSQTQLPVQTQRIDQNQAGPSHIPQHTEYAYPSAQPSFSSSPSSESTHEASRPPTNGGPFVEPHQELNDFLEKFWTRQMDVVEREEQDGKVNVCLPLARIKKVMKSDEEVKMISAEVPIMFSKACEGGSTVITQLIRVFISELTCRAWLVAESHKRRTLQKSDVAAAIAHSDMFDFLIDIVPRDGDDPVDDQSKAPSVDEGGDEGDESFLEFVEEER